MNWRRLGLVALLATIAAMIRDKVQAFKSGLKSRREKIERGENKTKWL